MSDRFKVSSLLARRLGEHKVSVPAVLGRAGLPAGFFQQEKIFVTTSELFALWRAIGETSPDPAIGLKLGAEPRFERYQPSAIAAVCSRSFRDALQRMARYKKLTCPAAHRYPVDPRAELSGLLVTEPIAADIEPVQSVVVDDHCRTGDVGIVELRPDREAKIAVEHVGDGYDLADVTALDQLAVTYQGGA